MSVNDEQTQTVSLSAIRKPIEAELRQFDAYFRDALTSRVKLVDMIARYIIRQKGKRVRPMLVLLSAAACGGVTEATYRAAALVEILHSATLVHDDVVDDADTRRGVASINAVWKNKVAVLMGDYLLSRGLLLALEYSDYHALRSTSNAVKRMSEGELLQIQKSRQLNINEETYLKIIADKTASLFSTCTDIGAASVTTDATVIRRMADYGECVGVAFQIRDDLFDYLSRTSIIGKPTGIDMKEKKLTLPLIHALKTAPRKESEQMLSVIKRGAKQREVERLIEFVHQNGGIDYAKAKALEFAGKAKALAAELPASDARQSLIDFVDFVMQRNV